MRTLDMLLILICLAGIAAGQEPEPILLEGHTASIVALAWSPDGKTLASTGADKSIRLWPAEGGEPVVLKMGAAGTALAWSPDGTILASGGKDNRVRLWDPKTGKEASVVKEHLDHVRAITFTGDSRSVVSVDDKGKFVGVEIGKKTAFLEWESGRSHVPFAAIYGQSLGVLPGDKGDLILYDLRTKKELRTILGDHKAEYSAALSRDGRRLASAVSGNGIVIWDVDTGTADTVFEGHKNDVLSLAWDGEGAKLVSGSADKTVKVWNVGRAARAPKKNKEEISFKGPQSGVDAVAITRDGDRVAGASAKTIRVWTLGK